MKILLLAFKPGTEPRIDVDEKTGAATVSGIIRKAYTAEVGSMRVFDEIVERTQE